MKPGHRKVPLSALATTPANESAAAASSGAAMKWTSLTPCPYPNGSGFSQASSIASSSDSAIRSPRIS